MKQLSLWKYNKRTGYYDHVRNVTAETSDGWLKTFRDDEPNEEYKVATSRPSKGTRFV